MCGIPIVPGPLYVSIQSCFISALSFGILIELCRPGVDSLFAVPSWTEKVTCPSKNLSHVFRNKSNLPIQATNSVFHLLARKSK